MTKQIFYEISDFYVVQGSVAVVLDQAGSESYT